MEARATTSITCSFLKIMTRDVLRYMHFGFVIILVIIPPYITKYILESWCNPTEMQSKMVRQSYYSLMRNG